MHVDMNSYFATLLQQETPYLRGKPVVVVKDIGRTCVIACSKEAKRIGVKTGMSLADAKKRTQNLYVVPVNFPMFLDCTKKLYKMWKELAPNPEIFSMDEVFLDMNTIPTRVKYKSEKELGFFIQQNVKRTLGEWVTCNVGIGPTRLLAKILGEISEKGSVCSILWTDRLPLLADVLVVDVCGVGRALAKKLACFGVYTPLQIPFLGKETLISYFGSFWAEELLKISNGEDPSFLQRILAEPKERSVGRTTTGFSLCSDRQEILRVFFALCCEVMKKSRALHLYGRTVFFFMMGRTQSAHHRITCTSAITSTKTLFEFAQQWVQSLHAIFPVIRWGVYLSNTQKDLPPSLFPSQDEKHEQIERVLDQLQSKYGSRVLRYAIDFSPTLPDEEVTGFFGEKRIHLQDV